MLDSCFGARLVLHRMPLISVVQPSPWTLLKIERKRKLCFMEAKRKEKLCISELFLLSESQMEQISPYILFLSLMSLSRDRIFTTLTEQAGLSYDL